MTRLTDLRVEHAREPLALHTLRPRFSWVLDPEGAAGVRQVAFELEVEGVLSTGRVESPDSVLVDLLDADLAEATAYVWRARLGRGSRGSDRVGRGRVRDGPRRLLRVGGAVGRPRAGARHDRRQPRPDGSQPEQ